MKSRTKGASTAIPLSILFAAIVVGSFVLSTSAKGERAMGSGIAYRVSEELGATLDKLLSSGKVLSSILESIPFIDEAQAAAIAEGILEGNSNIVGVSTAPGAIIDRYYPVEAGVAWKGHDLLSNPERKDALLKAVKLKSPVVTGPFESVDGSFVLFLRFPVYSGTKFWGFVSLTADFPKILASLDLERRYPGIVFALADVSQPKAPKFLGGKESAMDGEEASAGLSRQGIVWKVYAAPKAGWTSSIPFLYVLLVAGLASAVLLYLLLTRKATVKVSLEDKKGRAKLSPQTNQYLSAIETSFSIPLPQEIQDINQQPFPAEKRGNGLFPDLAIIEKKRGRTITFRGQTVKGDLFMPDRLLTGWGETVKNVESSPPAMEPVTKEPATKEPATEEPVIVSFAHQVQPEAVPSLPVVPLASVAVPPGRKLLFSIEEEKPTKDLAILVVDDSEANRDIVGRMLSLRGFRADFAASGAEAIEAASSKAYEVVFMDSYMPGMDGYAASRAIRNSKLNSRTFIVGMSARIGQQELNKCKASGMDEMLAKPFTLKQLLAFLER